MIHNYLEFLLTLKHLDYRQHQIRLLQALKENMFDHSNMGEAQLFETFLSGMRLIFQFFFLKFLLYIDKNRSQRYRSKKDYLYVDHYDLHREYYRVYMK